MPPASVAHGFAPGHLRDNKQASSHGGTPARAQAVDEEEEVSDEVTQAVSAPKFRIRRRPSKSSTSGTQLRDANPPQPSERESVFATNYMPDTGPLTAPAFRPKRNNTSEGGSSEEDGSAGMALSSPRPTSALSSSSSTKDTPASALGYQSQANTSASERRRRNRSSLPLTYHRRSLHDIHDVSALLRHMQGYTDQSAPDSDLHDEDLPTTPIAAPTTTEPEPAVRSAERQQYRSWRQGNAKLEGLSIAESQRRQSRAENGVDQIIDAQLPQPESSAPVRSRKASHYLGLFKDHGTEEREGAGQKRERDRETRYSQRQKQNEQTPSQSQPPQRETPRKESAAPTGASTKGVQAAQGSKKYLPVSLLEEIRNHHQLAPGAAWKTKYQAIPKEEPEGRHRQDDQLEQEQEQDEESEREHISSATYFPHQGVSVSHSPPDDHMVERKTGLADEAAKPSKPSGQATDEVDIALRSEQTKNYLHGDISLSRPPSTTDFELLPKPLIPRDASVPSDSEYDSLSEGYDTTQSEKSEITPTATPKIKAKSRSPQRPPPPIGAVELTPYGHQVGGHTTMYKFSRRAVCKQLNSKENIFYETIEKFHPELLGFMPKYIGVLNVTYRKEQRKRKPTITAGSSNGVPNDATQAQSGKFAEASSDTKTPSSNAADQPRVVSHSQQAPSAIPQVIFENNRHLIPESLFGMPRRSVTPDLRRNEPPPSEIARGHSEDESSGSGFRPYLRARAAASWGYTTVNENLRDRVLREVFAPPPIHRHDRRERRSHTRAMRRIPKHLADEFTPAERRHSTDVSASQPPFESSSFDPSKSRSRPRLRGEMHTESDVHETIGSSAAAMSRNADIRETDDGSKTPGSRNHRRRHSGGGLKRRPQDVEGARGDLEYHEDEDYRADTEDVFTMDDDMDKSKAKKSSPPSKHQEPQNHEASIAETAPAQSARSSKPRLGPAVEFSNDIEPRNPEVSLVQHDSRVEHFLLLEDLTANMQRPCVLDLKMGTRQYGIEANEKKQASQRRKCKTTTSRELGVRICGMQVYNVREQNYLFQDKYYGRDVKAGGEFREALKQFFCDGIGYAAALKHIPAILEKITALDRMIRDLPGYRLYASSLLMIYDRGDADEKGKQRPPPPPSDTNPDSTSSADNKPTTPYTDIKLKIVDFANCVTAEDAEMVSKKPCPPYHPGDIDRGYLRGLRTLRMYFQKIWEELHYQRFVERGEGEGMAVERRGISGAVTTRGWADSVVEDPGEVSV